MTPAERKRLSDKAAAQTAANRENALAAHRVRGDELFESSMRTSTDEPNRLFCDDLTDKIIRLTNRLKKEGRPLVPCFDVEPDLSSLFAALTLPLSFFYESVTLGDDGQLHRATKEETSPYAAKVENLRTALYDYCVETAAIAHKIGSATEADWRKAFTTIQLDCLRGETDFCPKGRAVEVMRTIESAAETLYADGRIHAAMVQPTSKTDRKAPSAAKVPRKKEPAKSAPSSAEQRYGRFIVKPEGGFTTIQRQNEMNSPMVRYKVKTNSRAYQIILDLLKDYKTGAVQFRTSEKDWPGAFQDRGKSESGAYEFMKEEILRVPRWDNERKRWYLTQFMGKWRIWTDAERRLKVKDRLDQFMREHPNGIANRQPKRR